MPRPAPAPDPSSMKPWGEKDAAFLRTLLDTLPDLVWLKDPDGVYLECNQRFARFFGAPKEEILGRTDYDFVDRGQADFFRAQDRLALATGGPAVNEEEITFREDGHREYLETIKTTILGPDGRILGVLGIGRDITARKRAEDGMRVSEEKYHQAFHNSPLLSSLSRMEDGRVLEVNDRYCQALGFTREEVLGRTSEELGILAPEVRARMIAALEATRSVRNLELPVGTRDGHTFPCLFFAEAFQVGSEQLLLVMALDNRERHAAEDLQRKLDAELHQMQKLDSLGSLASGVAHDMNNVLGAIQALTETVAGRVEGDAFLSGRLGLIVRACARGRDLVKGLTHFARKDLREPESLDLNAMVAEEMELLSRTTLQKVHLVMDLEKNLPRVTGEGGTLSSALMNLCVNAVDAMPGGGTLTLRTRAVPPDTVEVQVEDTGEGMSAPVLARALEPFYTTKPIGKGTGMGLSMAYATLKAHGGNLTIRSAPGQGTRVTLTLPAGPAHAGAAPVPDPEPPPAGPLRILLVDDDPLILSTIPDLIEALGHPVATASSGQAALDRIASADDLDLVILDLNMPGMNGVDTLKGLRQLRPRLPVLMATGFLDEETGEILLRDGRALSILKPFSKAHLGRKITEIGSLGRL